MNHFRRLDNRHQHASRRSLRLHLVWHCARNRTIGELEERFLGRTIAVQDKPLVVEGKRLPPLHDSLADRPHEIPSLGPAFAHLLAEATWVLAAHEISKGIVVYLYEIPPPQQQGGGRQPQHDTGYKLKVERPVPGRRQAGACPVVRENQLTHMRPA